MKFFIMLLMIINVYAAEYFDGVNAYRNGNYTKAIDIFKPLADKKNDARAQYNLATMYFYAKGTPQDYKLAYKYFSKAAKNGMKEASFMCGQMLENGLGVKRDFKDAVKFYSQAAEEKYPRALYALGKMYQNGLGVKKSIVKAKELYLQSANNGLVGSMYDLGLLYEKEKDYDNALKWYIKAEKYMYPNAKEKKEGLCKKYKSKMCRE